jgi:hypothetical protein
MTRFDIYTPCERLKPYVKHFVISESDEVQTYKILPFEVASAHHSTYFSTGKTNFDWPRYTLMVSFTKSLSFAW